MKKQQLPKGWSQEKLREIADFHDQMTDAEVAAEIDGAQSSHGLTPVMVPTELVGEVRAFIAQQKAAD